MSSLDEILEQWLKEVKEITFLSTKEQQKITRAGAKVYAEALKQETKKRHYSNRKNPTYGHLADSVLISNKNIDGIKTGSTVVGFDHYHATIARQLNNGTIKYSADHFVEEIREEYADDMLDAMKKQYEKILKKRGV